MYPILILLPFLSVIILNLPFRAMMRRCAFGLCLLILILQACFAISGGIFGSSSVKIISPFINFDLAADNLSLLLLFSIAIIFVVVLFVQRYLSNEKERFFNFINMLLLMLAGINGLVLVRDIFSLYVFIEIVSVGSFILIAYNDDVLAFEGAFKYLVLSVVATVLMLAAIAIIFMVTGDTAFSSVGAALASSPNKTLITFAMGLFLCALFLKSGLMPFHGWVADVYSASPASVSVLMSGIVTKSVGVYALIRIVVSVFGANHAINLVLLAVGAFSVVCAALAALGQSDFKRMLAYSSISQVGYIILGLGCGTPLGLAGAAFHIFNHAIFKSLLFVNSAAVEAQAGTRDMNRLSGVAKKMPVTGVASILASLSCAGIPPLAGFWSKLIIIVALWMAGFRVYAIIAVLASLLTLAYFLSLQRRVFWGGLNTADAQVREAGFDMLFPTLLLAAITVMVGLFAPFIISAYILPIGKILGG